MKQKIKPTNLYAHAYTIKAAAAVMLLFFYSALHAQNQVAIYRYSFDKLLIVNRANHSITVQIGTENKFVISRGSSREVPFSLTYSHVKETPFVVSYDDNSFREDLALCNDIALVKQRQNENFLKAMGLVWALFHEEMKFEKFIILLKAINWVFDNPTPQLDQLMENLGKIWYSDMDAGQKETEIKALIETFYDRSIEIEDDRQNCADIAQRLLGKIQPATYYAYQFINMQERSRIEITPYLITGYRTKLFRNVGDKSTIQRMDFKSQPYYGLRTALNINAYNKYGKRKIDTKYYIPVSFNISPVVYKQNAYDSLFTNNKAYSWLTYSLGFGWEFNYYNAAHTRHTSSAFLDFGVISSTLKQYGSDSVKLSKGTNASSLKGFAPYINIGYKIRVTNWLDLYGAYYTTFLYTNLKYDKKDMPSFRQFNLGLNFNIVRHYSYQY